MLDQTKTDDQATEDTVAAEDGQDTISAEEVQPEEIVVTIEGEEPEVDDNGEVDVSDEEYQALGDAGKATIQRLKNAVKFHNDQRRTAVREARELKAQIAAKEAAGAGLDRESQEDYLGPQPTYADNGFDDAKTAQAIIDWHEKKRVIDAKKAAAETEAKARETAYQEKLTKYHAERGRVGVDDDAQAVVVAALSPQQQSALMDASLDPAKVVAALSKTPKVLAELAGIKEIHRFTYKLAQIEGKITMTTKTPPPPESKLRGGVAIPAGNLAAQLDAAEKRADQTGDRTEVQRIKRQMKDAGVAA